LGPNPWIHWSPSQFPLSKAFFPHYFYVWHLSSLLFFLETFSKSSSVLFFSQHSVNFVPRSNHTIGSLYFCIDYHHLPLQDYELLKGNDLDHLT
jgi:hypothetical protein